VPVNIGEAAVDTVVVISKLLVIQSEQMENCGVKVVNGGDILNGFASKLIGCAVAARLDASP